MSLLHWLLSPAWLPLLGALVHSLWQGALISAALLLILRQVPARCTGLRYSLSVAALIFLVLMVVTTWLVLQGTAPVLVNRWTVIPTSSLHQSVRRDHVPLRLFAPDPPASAWWGWLAAGWLLGVGSSLLKTMRGLFVAQRMRRAASEMLDPRVLSMVDRLRTHFQFSKRVRVLISIELSSPAVMGIVRPILLLPAGLCTGVPMDVLGAILAHEMAHIRRADYLVNLGQLLVEALLFFNPFIWWINRQIRLEREAACDHLAAACCSSEHQYVDALLAFVMHHQEQFATLPPLPVLGILGTATASEHRGDVVDRTRRLLEPNSLPVAASLQPRSAILTMMIVAAICVVWGYLPYHPPDARNGQAARTGGLAAHPTASGYDGAAVITSSRIFANAKVGDRHLQVMVERYVDGRQVLTVVNGRLREAPPTLVNAVKVRLYGKDGSEQQPKSILDETGTLACLDRGWRFRVAENALYDLAGVDLAELVKVQVELFGQKSACTPLRSYVPPGKDGANVATFQEASYLYRPLPLRLYTVHWQPSS